MPEAPPQAPAAYRTAVEELAGSVREAHALAESALLTPPRLRGPDP